MSSSSFPAMRNFQTTTALTESELYSALAATPYFNNKSISEIKASVLAIRESNQDALIYHKRIMIKDQLIPSLLLIFSESAYFESDEDWFDLLNIYHYYKSDLEGLIEDAPLIELMFYLFEERCEGNMSYLEGTCMPQLVNLSYDLGRAPTLDELQDFLDETLPLRPIHEDFETDLY